MLAEPDRSWFIDVNRTRLRVWEWGEPDAPPIVCSHGAYDHGRMWDGFAPLVAALGYRVLCLDLRGHGDSGRLSSGSAWAAVALDIAAVAMSLGEPVRLLGHSWGGEESVFVAGVWPELVRWVVSIDGLGPPPGFDRDEVTLAERSARSLASAERVLTKPARVYATLGEMVDRRAGINVRLPREWVEHLVRHGSRRVEGGYVWKADPMFSVGFPGAFSMEAFEAEWAAVEAPVLFIAGAEPDTWSELTPAQLAARAGLVRDGRLVVVDGAGHYVHVERPDATLDAVAAFVKEVDQ